MAQVTVASPTNIAVIKYWGKRDSKLNLPINSSVSITINQADLRTVTTVTASKNFVKDRLWLNGEEEDVEGNKRVLKVFAMVRARSNKWQGMNVQVVSVNNFPTAAGLASSAAGYAALAFALGKLYGIEESYEGDLSTIARVGSGSACRSLAGGFVAWDMGSKADGTDSCARQVAPADHWCVHPRNVVIYIRSTASLLRRCCCILAWRLPAPKHHCIKTSVMFSNRAQMFFHASTVASVFPVFLSISQPPTHSLYPFHRCLLYPVYTIY
eukprot:6715035-Prymnesium_polylepis.1